MFRWNLQRIAYALFVTSLTTNAYAVASGFYIGGQIAYARLNQLKIPSSSVSGDVNSVSASVKPSHILIRSAIAPSLQIQATPGSFTPPIITAFKNNGGSSGFLGRIFVGYQFLPWIGAELGFFQVSDVSQSYKALTLPGLSTLNVVTINGIPSSSTFNSLYGSVGRNDTISRKAIDIFVKLMYPVYDIFDVWVKLGGAYVRRTTNSILKVDNFTNGSFVPVPGTLSPPFPGNGTYFSTNPLRLKTSSTVSKFSPAISFGATYYYQQNLGLDISYTQIGSVTSFNNNTKKGGKKTNTNNTNSINYFALGVSYHIVDKYCGQFLCD